MCSAEGGNIILLRSAHLYRSSSIEKVANTASDEREQVCEIVDAPVSSKSDVLKHFCFSVRRKKKGEKVMDREKTICRHKVCFNSNTNKK